MELKQFLDICAARFVTGDLEGLYEDLSKSFKAPKDNSAQKLIAAYCEAYKKKNGHNPVILPKDGTTAKSIVKSLGLEKAIEMVETYVRMENQYFILKSHDFNTFYFNLNTVKQKHENGTSISRLQAQRVEQNDVNKQVMKSYLRKKNERD